MHSFYLPPGNLDFITVAGPDAAKLLQGQLTCDVDAVADPGFTRGALCNNKGRVYATFVLVRHGGRFYVVLGQGLGAIFKAALRKYLPFYKCELRDAAAGELCFGICGNVAAAALDFVDATLPAEGQCRSHEDGWICALAPEHYVVHSADAPPASASVANGTLEDWHVRELLAGHFPFTPADAEQYTPQEIHLDRHGYVSFTKGCYTGQEIVARMHYRGKTKKLLFLLEAPAPGKVPTESMEILDASGQVLGSTIKLLEGNGRLYGLAVLPAELEQGLVPFVKNGAGLRFSSRIF